MRVSVSDLLQSIPLPITRREVNIHASVMLLAPGDEPASSPDAEGNCWITLLCAAGRAWGAGLFPWMAQLNGKTSVRGKVTRKNCSLSFPSIKSPLG